MALTEKKDFVFVPKATLVLNGVTFACVVATRKYLFVVPFESISEVGRYTETETVSIGGTTPEEYIMNLVKLPDITVSKLEETLMKVIEKNPDYFVEIAALAEFNIKAGFFSKGVYYKKPGDRGYTGIGISGKQNALNLQEFYGK